MRRAGNGSPLTIDLKEGQQKISWGGKTQGRGRLRRTGRPEEQVDGRLCLIGVRFVRTTCCLCPVVAGWTYEFIAIHGGSWTPAMNRIVARYCRPDLRLLLAIDRAPSSSVSVWSDGIAHTTVCRVEPRLHRPSSIQTNSCARLLPLTRQLFWPIAGGLCANFLAAPSTTQASF
jgi:hypothetical protein